MQRGGFPKRRVLLVEDAPGDAALAKNRLADCDVVHR